jgi:hypothetical protein
MRWRYDETKRKIGDIELKIQKIKVIIDKLNVKIKDY